MHHGHCTYYLNSRHRADISQKSGVKQTINRGDKLIGGGRHASARKSDGPLRRTDEYPPPLFHSVTAGIHVRFSQGTKKNGLYESSMRISGEVAWKMMRHLYWTHDGYGYSRRGSPINRSNLCNWVLLRHHLNSENNNAALQAALSRIGSGDQIRKSFRSLPSATCSAMALGIRP
ncbi:hypothetical protein WP2W18E01_13910 [Aeromonas caviae]|uniref:Uncharacterized protein n=1 Tax=Aeromonas caviae TaxID=648 RepID=A0A6S4TLJ0_AERCA|nr:hypothetical protein WP2W18E01_13910 [Aeromonas caviae]